MKKILFIFGTRPEAIKMVPLIKELKSRKSEFDLRVCVTGQHREMLDQVLNFFSIKPDYDLNVMKAGQTLFGLTARIMDGLEEVINDFNPDIILVQGDTTTALVGALAGYYKQVDVGHVEAGLRSGNTLSPFPEEMNRVLIGRIAKYHFVPTQRAYDTLLAEGVKKQNVFNVGNTVIDALMLCLSIIKTKDDTQYSNKMPGVDFSKRILLVTGHRRESFGDGFESMCRAILQLANSNKDVELVYPVHLNPNVQEPVHRLLDGVKNIHLIQPLDYPELIWLMEKSYIVITDSGGIQEEAPSLGKPVLVMRDVTERQEGIEAGTAKLVGTNAEVIYRETQLLLDNEQAYQKIANAVNPYGDGTTARQIADILEQ